MKRKAKKKARFDSENIQSACFLFDSSELLHRQSALTSARKSWLGSYLLVEPPTQQ